MVTAACCLTWAGVPLVNQTARGTVSISVMRAASLRSWACSSEMTCCGAPADGGGMKNRVPGVMPRAAAAGTAVLAAALAAGSTAPAATAADTATAAAAQRTMRLERGRLEKGCLERRRLERGRRMLTPGTVSQVTGTFPEKRNSASEAGQQADPSWA